LIPFYDLQKLTNSFQPELDEAMQRVVQSGQVILGEEVQCFEHEYASFIGTQCCVGVGNGYDALYLIFKAYIELGVLKEGDEVLVPANTFIATILAVTNNGLKAVLVEPDINTYNLNPFLIEKKISERTKVIVLVHLYGRCAMHEEIERLAKKYNLLLIEDNAQASGCLYGNKRTGSLGHAAAHSFYPTKNLGALGDGGAITTGNEKLKEVIASLRNYGSLEKSVHVHQGVNSRLDEIQTAVLRVKLKRLDEDNLYRRNVAIHYQKSITNPLLILPSYAEAHVWHLFVIRCAQRDRLKRYLAENGIQTMVHYPIPPHKQQTFKNWTPLDLPVTEQIHDEVLSLPLNPILKQYEIDKVIDSINHFL
jgi:dTDP-4-amino-4,6-dideoxygalactose transaminase